MHFVTSGSCGLRAYTCTCCFGVELFRFLKKKLQFVRRTIRKHATLRIIACRISLIRGQSVLRLNFSTVGCPSVISSVARTSRVSCPGANSEMCHDTLQSQRCRRRRTGQERASPRAVSSRRFPRKVGCPAAVVRSACRRQ